MTGEITLSGAVLPVGGIREKVLAARRYGITTFILPERNAVDIPELPEEVRARHDVRAGQDDRRGAGAGAAAVRGARCRPPTPRSRPQPPARRSRPRRMSRSRLPSRCASLAWRGRDRTGVRPAARAARHRLLHLRPCLRPRLPLHRGDQRRARGRRRRGGRRADLGRALAVRRHRDAAPSSSTNGSATPGWSSATVCISTRRRTIEEASRFMAGLEPMAQAEADFLRRRGATLVVGDIPPLAFRAAHLAGLPAVALGNFTWDWIYEGYRDALAGCAGACARHPARLPSRDADAAVTDVGRIRRLALPHRRPAVRRAALGACGG